MNLWELFGAAIWLVLILGAMAFEAYYERDFPRSMSKGANQQGAHQFSNTRGVTTGGNL